MSRPRATTVFQSFALRFRDTRLAAAPPVFPRERCRVIAWTTYGSPDPYRRYGTIRLDVSPRRIGGN